MHIEIQIEKLNMYYFLLGECVILQEYYLTWIFYFITKRRGLKKIRKENKFSMKLANTNVSCTWRFKSLYIYSFYKKTSGAHNQILSTL